MSQEKHSEHGGDVYAASRALGTSPDRLLDLSANINPLGYPPGLRETAQEAFEMIKHYPDPYCRDLRTEIARHHGLSPEEILIGNGSTELIYLVARALHSRGAMVVTPAFSEYERALRLAQVPITFHPTSEANDFTINHLPNPDGCDTVFLANPTNPSGALLLPDQLLPVLEALEPAGAYAVLDEAFIDFVEDASMKTYLRNYPSLIILRSFTKFFGIPGIRLGYVLASETVIKELEDCSEPWTVNVLAQALGRACLEDVDFMIKTREVIAQEREYLCNQLANLDSLYVFPGKVNYLLCKLTRSGWTAARLQRKMLEHGIIIRDASNFRGLDGRFFRIAVRLRHENDRLLNALRACLPQG